jgi:hypothetical protein
MTKKRNLKIEKAFKKMLENSPNKVCLNAMKLIMKELENDKVDVTEMKRLLDEKIKESKLFILPLPRIK